MISFCCGFYPWYREHDRTQEVFDVLIAGLNTMHGVEDTELCFVSAAVMDVWRPKPEHNPRKLDNGEFEEKIRKQFKGKVNFLLDEGSIHGRSKTPRYWCSKSIKTAVDISTNDYVLIVGIDCYITGYFLSDYFYNVKNGQAWIVMATGVQCVEDIEYYEANQLVRYWYTPKGIVGILKDDYYKMGGLNVDFLKDKVDTNFYLRLMESDSINVKEDRVKNVYHVWHPGSHMGGASRLNERGRVETCKFA